MSNSRKALIVNADDYGFTPEVSAGIREAHLNGILTSTTVLATGESVESDAEFLKKECPDIGIGVHLALTSVNSILPRQRIPSLVNENSVFFKLNELINMESSIIEKDVYNEWKAQIEKVRSLGLEIDHLDSHHYVCFLSRKTINVTKELAREYNLPVRTPVSPVKNTEYESIGKNELRKAGIKFPDYFHADFTKENGSQEVLLKLIDGLGNGHTEILSHAGKIDDRLRALSSLVDSRLTELQSLTSDLTKHTVKNNNVRLSTFGDLYL